MTKMTNRSLDTPHSSSQRTATTSALSIRPMELTDMSCLLEMIEALQDVTKDQLHLDQDALIDLLYAPAPWAQLLVADIDGEIIGYAALVGGLQLSAMDRAMQMHHLYVAPDHRGQGVARALTEAARATAHALGCGTLSVGIMSTSETAKAAYRAIGFARPSLRAPHYEMALA